MEGESGQFVGGREGREAVDSGGAGPVTHRHRRGQGAREARYVAWTGTGQAAGWRSQVVSDGILVMGGR